MAYFIKSVNVVNDSTVEVDMNASWSGFPFVLSDNAGKIVSPTQVQALGSSFGTVPCQCGAGPFMVKSFSPTSLDVVRNPNYYGKKAYLDGINFVIPPSDPMLALEQVKSGAFTTAFIQDPATDKAALAEKSDFDISAVYQWSGSSLQFNEFSGPTTNPLVRQALSYSVNPALLNERCYNGALTLSSAIVGKTSSYKIGVPGIQYNLTKAKDLLAQAKAGGYDGSIKLTTGNDTVSACQNTVISAMFSAAGFNVTTNEIPTSTITAAVLVSKAYQVATWGLSYDDSFLFFRMFQSFTSFGNRYGYTSPGMDEALTTMRMTNSQSATTAAIAGMQKVVNQDAPFLNISEGDKFLISSPKVHGFVPTSDACWLFNNVWMS
jgi:peptide/nickel transport system substrate-binding protein